MQNVKMPLNIGPLQGENGIYRSFLDMNVTPQDFDIARSELKETEEKRKTCLAELKEKLLETENLNCQMDDSHLLRYLRVRKFDVDRAYEMMKKYYRTQKDYPNYFSVPDNYEALLKYLPVKYLPFTDENGPIIAYIKAADWNLDELSFEELVSMSMSIGDVAGLTPTCQIHGYIAIFDFSSATWNHIENFLNPLKSYVTMSLFQNRYPWRNRKVIFVNSNRLARAFWNCIKPFLKKKLANRIVFLGNDISKLHQYVSPDILPPELGGTLDKRHYQPVEQCFIDNIDYVKYNRSFGYVK